jgi:probable HAF family extracellular repeat protein
MIPASRLVRAALGAIAWLALSVSIGCADSSQAPMVPTAPQLARTVSGPSVTATTPPYGRQGQTGEQVTITGSGFTADSKVSWARSGVADSTDVAVRNTKFVSSTQLVATIDIAPDADLAFYDVMVENPDRKKGIGTEMFEVTTAISLGSLGGNTNANAVNDNGDAVGYTVVGTEQRAFYWSGATGMVDIGGAEALGIDQGGTTIVGRGSARALTWTGSGTSWTSAPLPMDPAAIDGRATAVASDPVTGQATIIGGSESVSLKHATLLRPRLWKRAATGGWQKIDLSMPNADLSGTSSWVAAVNANGQATGAVRPGGGAAQAVVWEANGQYTVLGEGGAPGINGAGTIIASFNNSGAVYYTRNAVGDQWTGPLALPGGCSNGMGVDDAGNIIARRCPSPGSSRLTSVIVAPPYTTAIYLSGLGDVTEGGTAYGISRGGTYIAGTAPTKPTRVGARWRNPLF